MRGEDEIMGIILETARKDGRIRAAYMNGSRVNPNAPKDIYRDYDIVYVVTQTAPFIADKGWISRFGRPLVIQQPEQGSPKADFSRRYVWLMLFDDGNRIDLSIETKEEAAENFLQDKLTLLLLDKDGFLPKIPPPSDIAYHVQRPGESAFAACCNEFWWCLNNVAKGIARDEIPYAMAMLNQYVRAMLDSMACWYIGASTGFSVSAGKMGKYFKQYLPGELYLQYCRTYTRAAREEMWAGVFEMCSLFHELATYVCASSGFVYNQSEEDGAMEYLENVMENRYTGTD